MSTEIDTAPARGVPEDAVVPAGQVEQRRPRLVRAELRKIFTINIWAWLGILLLIGTALALAINVGQGNSNLASAEALRQHAPDQLINAGRVLTRAEQDELDAYNRNTDIPRILASSAANVYTSGQFVGLLLIVILGALLVTSEYSQQTATSTFLTTPARTKVVLAKLGAAMILAALFWLATTAFGVGIGALNFSLHGYGVPLTDPSVVRAVFMNLLAYALWAVLGVGLGILIRGQLGATLTATALYLSAWPMLLVIGLIASLVHSDVVYQFMVAVPGMASLVMVTPERMELSPGTFGPPWWSGALVLVAYGVISGVVGTVIARRRDIS